MKRKMIKGIEYLRIAPAKYANGREDYSYCGTAMVFDGMDENGNFIMHYPAGSIDGKALGTSPQNMGKPFSDGNWRPVDNPKTGVKTALHKFKGMKIQRVRPTNLGNGNLDYSFYRESVYLVSATRYHLVVKDELLEEMILDVRYANPDDWTVA